jgi:hypothetical protein
VVYVRTTSSNVDVHGALLIVQRSVAVAPDAKVTVLVGEFGLAMSAEPETSVQVPVAPLFGVLAAIVKFPLSHFD